MFGTCYTWSRVASLRMGCSLRRDERDMGQDGQFITWPGDIKTLTSLLFGVC